MYSTELCFPSYFQFISNYTSEHWISAWNNTAFHGTLITSEQGHIWTMSPVPFQSCHITGCKNSWLFKEKILKSYPIVLRKYKQMRKFIDITQDRNHVRQLGKGNELFHKYFQAWSNATRGLAKHSQCYLQGKHNHIMSYSSKYFHQWLIIWSLQQ